MRTKYSIEVAIIVGGLLGSIVAPRRADSQPDVSRIAITPPVEAGRKTVDSANFRIHAGWQPLFNGRNLDGWYTFLQQHGRDADPDHIVAVDDGVIHLYRDTANGIRVVQGYVATDTQYGNYHLRLQYRWGEKKFEPRKAMPRDAGVYYHMVGKDAVWPAGLQYQIQEDNAGDLLALFGLQADSWIDPATKDLKTRTFRDSKLGGAPVVFGGDGISYQTRGVMNELAGWNTVEIIARGNSVTHVLNGKTVNRCENVRKIGAKDPTHSSPVTKGRIALEIEAAEIQYRNIEIKQLDAEKSADKSPAKSTLSKEVLDLRVGASAVSLLSDKTMVIAGGIEPHYAAEQEGELRAMAVVVERPGQAKVAIVTCDVLFVLRDLVEKAVAEIEQKTGIPAKHVLINATHTHHAPSLTAVHGYGAEPKFRDELRRGIVRAVVEANSRLHGGEAKLFFHLGNEDTIGSNSRQLLEEGSITWTNSQEPSAKARPTGPFDPQLPVFDFRDAVGKSRALLFNHSTHTIGTRSGRDVRSPSFYGLAGQDLEKEFGGVVSFLEGASGSTHNVAPRVPIPECIERLKTDVREARAAALPRKTENLAAIRRPFKFRIRRFNDAEEDAKVGGYMMKYAPKMSDRYREVFANMRRQLRDRQGEEQETLIQAIVLGDVAIVGVPAEYFTVLGIDIKQRSPFEHTFVAELANDWIGYLPDREAHRLGGYQTWMGLHSYAEEGAGERMADEAVNLLNELADNANKKKAETKSANAKLAVPKGGKEVSPNARSPAAEHSSFRLADPKLRIDLVASEPDIVSPAAISWDADGRMYVAEMTGYPVTERRGRIRRLEDRDGDGRYEHAVTFCDELNFPTSVMPYRSGLLVTDSPDILYLEDTDGDSRADVRRVEWTGFGTKGSQQLRANSLHWGLDNWIYVANGRCDGDVRRADTPPAQATSIRARDFRFNPVTNQGEAILGQSQFGQAHDSWGNRFLSWNTIPLRHVLLEEADTSGYPAASAAAVVNVAEPSDAGRVYPIASPAKQFNTEQANYYNALCGLTIFTGDALGKEYAGNAFVCESLSSLVTRRLLEPDGPTFISRRSINETNREFLASTDNWFHPVNLTTGPDGALYVVDFYREFVEHPEYVADTKVRAEMNWRNGFEHGRIWRIRRSDADAPHAKRRPKLSSTSSAELVDVLNHPVAWWRTTAQRLLVERQDRSVMPQLRTILAESPSSLARLHAMYVLDGLDAAGAPRSSDDDITDKVQPALDIKSLRRALQDSDPRIRRQAVRLAAPRADRGDGGEIFRNDLIQMEKDPDSRVRFQLALAVGRCSDPRASRALVKLLSSDDTPSLQLAVLCGIGRKPWPLIKELLGNAEGAYRNATFLEQLSEQFALQANKKSLAECLDWLTANTPRCQSVGGLATLAGISRGLFARGQSLRNLTLPTELLPKRVAIALTESVSFARTLAENRNKSGEERARATVVAANSQPVEIEQLVRELVQPSQPQPVQSAAVWSAAQVNSSGVWRNLFQRWPSHTTATRAVMLVQAVRSPAGTEALITALESDLLSAQELSASTREILGQLKDESLRRRLEPIVAAARPADRDEILARYASVATRRGDAARGAFIFKQNCQTCHAIHGVGQKVGPDLTSVASRRTDLLITDILDPSYQVSPDYVNYLAVTNDGRVLTGLIAAETTESVTLRREEGQQETVLRSDIEQLRASGKSIMPDGLEQKLSPDQLTDLLEFLHNPDVHQLK